MPAGSEGLRSKLLNISVVTCPKLSRTSISLGTRSANPMRTRWSQVTHYYFRNCSYYTPLYSDPFYGNIFFRQIVDIGTGEPVPNMVSGREVPLWFQSQAIHHSPTVSSAPT